MSVWSWDTAAPADSEALVRGDNRIRADKATLSRLLGSLVPFGDATTSWFEVQIGNAVWLTYNARFTGTAWERVDIALPAAAVRYSTDGGLENLFAEAGPNPITWTSTWRVDAAAVETSLAAPGRVRRSSHLVYRLAQHPAAGAREHPEGNWIMRGHAAGEWYRVVWSSELGLFVATGNGPRVTTSPDGITWAVHSSLDGLWQGLAWSPELRLFVAVASSVPSHWDGTAWVFGPRVMTSPDGITWTGRTAAANNHWQSVAWSPELRLFAAVSTDGTHRVMTSPDGITWTARVVADGAWRGIAWSPKLRLFAAVAQLGVRVMTSPDGITWTARGDIHGGEWSDITWSPELELFVAVAGWGWPRVITSPDGIVWTDRFAQSRHWDRIAWSPELRLFAVTAHTWGGQVMTSPNGIVWTERWPIPSAGWFGVAWSPGLGLFSAVAFGGHTMTSTPPLAVRYVF